MSKISLELGSGGRLMRDFLAGTIVPAFARSPPRRALRRRPSSGRDRLHDGQLRRRPALLPRRGHRPPGRQRDGQRPRRRRRRAALPLARPHPRGGPRHRASSSASSARSGTRPGRRRSAIVTGRHQGRPPRPGGQDLHQHGRRRPVVARPRPGRIRRGDKIILTGHPRRPQPGGHARPRRLRLALERPERLRAAPLPPAALEGRAPCGCATSPAAGWPRSFRSWPSVSPIPFSSKKIRSRCRGRCGRRASSSGSIRSIWPAKGKPSSSRRPPRPRRSSAASAVIPSAGRAAVIGEVQDRVGRPGELLLRTAAGGLRLLEPLTSELLPRIC